MRKAGRFRCESARTARFANARSERRLSRALQEPIDLRARRLIQRAQRQQARSRALFAEQPSREALRLLFEQQKGIVRAAFAERPLSIAQGPRFE